jgi:HEAT repeat protein
MAAGLTGCNRDNPGTWSTKNASAALRSDVAIAPQVSLGVNSDFAQEKAELDRASLDILLQAADSASPMLRANAIEALQPMPQHLPDILRRALTDENRGVRFVAAMMVGRLKMTELAQLVRPLMEDASGSVQAAAIYALTRCGEPVDPTPLAGMLRSDSVEVKANAAMVLGELGEPSAAPMLKRAMGKGMTRESVGRVRVVDLQMAEALVKLGQNDELHGIRAALYAPAEQGEIVALACQITGNLNDRQAAADVQNIAFRDDERRMPAEVRMAAMAALAKLTEGVASISVPLEFAADPRPELRAQAALTLGAVGSRAGLPHLARMLADPNPMVQVSAAGAILRIR